MPFNGNTRKKRKLHISDFSKCNPAAYKYRRLESKRNWNKGKNNDKNGGGGDGKCLPSDFYKDRLNLDFLSNNIEFINSLSSLALNGGFISRH